MRQQKLLIKNGYVATIDPNTGDLPRADVRIDDGIIREIGVDLEPAIDAQIIDASGMIVLPGFVDTHRHVWQGAIGGTAGKVSLGGYFGVVIAGLAPRYEPDDVYAGTLWGALQALNAGITTLADWSHIVTTASPPRKEQTTQLLRSIVLKIKQGKETTETMAQKTTNTRHARHCRRSGPALGRRGLGA